ncbi:hypothetical protein CFF01_05675 [Shewanella marisflavi]|uniref:Uncharacterized protein n=1 Tax=Shewanella marisflavi TaxID=260364 RepID=A0AAC9XMZ4_9GAMM|nr:hypothetical protein CFF01_05675 [Shewanella marisflavi]
MCFHLGLPQAIQNHEGQRIYQRSKNLYRKMLEAKVSAFDSKANASKFRIKKSDLDEVALSSKFGI